MTVLQRARDRTVDVLLILFLVTSLIGGVVESAESGEGLASDNSKKEIADEPLESTESALRGRRLFFTPDQRLEAMSEMGSDARSITEGGSDVAIPLDSSSAEMTPGDNQDRGVTARPGHSSAPATPGVLFDAVVSGSRGVHLLVNGLPCVFPSPDSRELDGHATRVECPVVTQSQPWLNLSFVKGRLQVSEKHSVLGLLKPGEGL